MSGKLNSGHALSVEFYRESSSAKLNLVNAGAIGIPQIEGTV
jgi:hypothetical protein